MRRSGRRLDAATPRENLPKQMRFDRYANKSRRLTGKSRSDRAAPRGHRRLRRRRWRLARRRRAAKLYEGAVQFPDTRGRSTTPRRFARGRAVSLATAPPLPARCRPSCNGRVCRRLSDQSSLEIERARRRAALPRRSPPTTRRERHDRRPACSRSSSAAGRFVTEGQSRNVFWLALPTFGEAWPNNHPAVPTSARHGLGRW
jgi:hypothetical protein